MTEIDSVIRAKREEKVSYDTDFRDDKLIPDEIQHRLIYWRDTFREGEWDIARISAEVIEAYAENGYKTRDGRRVTNAILDKATGHFAGKTGRTIRYYRETAMFFPDGIEQEYPTVPFTHFAVARRAQENWREVLNYSALTNCNEETLEAIFVRNYPDAPIPVEVTSDGGRNADDKVREISRDNGEPSKAHDDLDRLSDFLTVVNQVLNQVRINKELDRARVLSMLGNFEDLIEQYEGSGDLLEAADYVTEVLPTAINAIEATGVICSELMARIDRVASLFPPLILADKQAKKAPEGD